MQRIILSACFFLITTMCAIAKKATTVTLNIFETTDVHGAFFPWDFINNRPMTGTLARFSTFAKRKRMENPDGVILLENGDILQGQPINYYYNYIETQKANIASSIINYLKYDVQTWGNHDVETGHACYDKWDAEINCPVISCNVIDKASGKPHLKPYTIINRQGVRVAVIGMITPAVPNWLVEDLWSGLSFRDMVSSATEWVEYVKTVEKPDVIVGLFHAGREGGITTPEYTENASEAIAQTVPGFDVIMFGHDHVICNKTVKCSNGKNVLIINAANNAQNIAEAVVTITKKGNKVISKNIEGKIHNIRTEDVDADFMTHFDSEINDVKKWAARTIGTNLTSITTRDSFFGSSAFTDLVHNLQIELTDADISFSAPLTFNASLNAGPITVSDMFKLYKFENKLYVMNLTGEEIKNYLEMSYDLWVNTMTSPDDHIMKLDVKTNDGNERNGFKNMTFNFDSAAGIDYVVDVTKPKGQKIIIKQMTNGEPFELDRTYKVAVNSYRGNGGGELLTQGAGIPKDSLDSRIIFRTDRDLRWYLMQEIEKLGTINPKANNNWRFIPDEWAVPALARDRKLIFGK